MKKYFIKKIINEFITTNLLNITELPIQNTGEQNPNYKDFLEKALFTRNPILNKILNYKSLHCNS